MRALGTDLLTGVKRGLFSYSQEESSELFRTSSCPVDHIHVTC